MSATEIRVCIDVGSAKHQVAIELSDGVNGGIKTRKYGAELNVLNLAFLQ